MRLFILFACSVFVTGALRGQPATDSPEAALKAFKSALEGGDLKKLATLTLGAPAQVFAGLAEPMAKAKAANSRFEKALQVKNIAYKNFVGPGLSPWSDLQFDLVEITKENNQTLARVKYGFGGRAQEETVLMQPEGNTWRIGLPVDLSKQLPRKTELNEKVKGIDRLSAALTRLAEEVEQGKHATKEAVAQRFIELVGDSGPVS